MCRGLPSFRFLNVVLGYFLLPLWAVAVFSQLLFVTFLELLPTFVAGHRRVCVVLSTRLVNEDIVLLFWPSVYVLMQLIKVSVEGRLSACRGAVPFKNTDCFWNRLIYFAWGLRENLLYSQTMIQQPWSSFLKGSYESCKGRIDVCVILGASVSVHRIIGGTFVDFQSGSHDIRHLYVARAIATFFEIL